eukprot:10229754-Lingulodinium_polyedra.AAC.1
MKPNRRAMPHLLLCLRSQTTARAQPAPRTSSRSERTLAITNKRDNHMYTFLLSGLSLGRYQT